MQAIHILERKSMWYRLGKQKRNFYKIAILIVVAITLAISPQAFAKGKGSSGKYHSYKGAKAIDGDTFRYAGKRYRIRQYNAPEIGQPGSRSATRSLQNKINSGNYKWKPVARDAYGRTIVREGQMPK